MTKSENLSFIYGGSGDVLATCPAEAGFIPATTDTESVKQAIGQLTSILIEGKDPLDDLLLNIRNNNA